MKFAFVKIQIEIRKDERFSLQMLSWIGLSFFCDTTLSTELLFKEIRNSSYSSTFVKNTNLFNKMRIEKEVSYTTINSYSTLNSFTGKTKNVWMVFHGMGYLSKYFIRYFSELDSDENYIISPQAPSKYYQDKGFKHVGASWLTRENTDVEIENVLNYIDAVFQKEITGNIPNLIVMGYSQGVSIATRWVAKRKIQCDLLVLHSGGIPIELKPVDFEFLKSKTKVIYLYGDKDQYITEARKTEEQLKGSKLFKNRLITEVFDGIHEVNKEFLLKISREIIE